MNKDLCSDISVIPQFDNASWFNTILMCILYSQGMRKLMINKVSKTWKKNSSLHKFLKTILKYNYKSDKKEITRLFNLINPKLLLLKILSNNDKVLYDKLLLQDTNWFPEYITMFLHYLNVKTLDITYDENKNKCYFNYFKNVNSKLFSLIDKTIFNLYYYYNNQINENKEKEEMDIKNILKETPDVLILYHSKLNKTNANVLTNKSMNVFDSSNYGFNIDDLKDIKEYKDEINFNGYTYKLDNVLLENYNDILHSRHTIAGITCGNKKYVYNGWIKLIKGLFFTLQIILNKNEPCTLMKFDWDLNKTNNFCLDSFNCKLKEAGYLDYVFNLCFSFNKGNRILVYVKTDKNKTSSIKSSSFSSLSNKKLIKNDVEIALLKKELQRNKIKKNKYPEL